MSNGNKPPKAFKKGYSLEGLNEPLKDGIDRASIKNKQAFQGMGDGPFVEATGDYAALGYEKVLDNRMHYQNSGIVFGKDRPRNIASGRGPTQTQCATIDIVVGYQGANIEDGKKVNPDFFKDAARIYISQKTDVDENFRLSPGTLGSPAPRSAIALKADGIRIVARDGIKLVTGTDHINSQQGKIWDVGGIDLIAGNDLDTLAPLVRGDNLIAALKKMVKHINNLTGIVDSFLTHQMSYNEALADHFHLGFYGKPTNQLPEPWRTGAETQVNLLSQSGRSCIFQKTNLGNFEKDYLEWSGDKYINSRFNHTN